MKLEYYSSSESELQTLNTQDKSLWKKTKYITKHTDRIPPLKDGNKWHSTPEEKVELFSQQLCLQFQPNPCVDINFSKEVEEFISQPLQLSPFSTYFTPAQVKNAIQRSPKKKAPGYDHIVQPLLDNFPRNTLVQLTQIYNGILRLTYFPQK